MASTTSAAPANAGDQELPELYRAMDAAHIQGLWTQAADLMTARPRPRAIPWLWPWEQVRALAARAGRAVPIERGGERRALAMANPGLGGKPYATPTLWAAMQYLNAGESAPAHRHSPAAIRFVLHGSGVWTTVNGEPCPMDRGDLVLTPSMAWHEHHSGSGEPMIWFDGLDLPLVDWVDATFFDNAPAEYLDDLGAAPAESRSAAVYGHPGLLPDASPETDRHSPLMVYRWATTDRALAELVAAADDGRAEVRFIDPRNGRDALPTMRCSVLRLAPGRRTETRRTVGSSVAVVFSGHGRTVVDGVRFDWGPGDTLALPSWCAVDHEALAPADLFLLSDAPVVEALRLDRTETLDEPQEITRAWDGG